MEDEMNKTTATDGNTATGTGDSNATGTGDKTPENGSNLKDVIKEHSAILEPTPETYSKEEVDELVSLLGKYKEEVTNLRTEVNELKKTNIDLAFHAKNDNNASKKDVNSPESIIYRAFFKAL